MTSRPHLTDLTDAAHQQPESWLPKLGISRSQMRLGWETWLRWWAGKKNDVSVSSLPHWLSFCNTPPTQQDIWSEIMNMLNIYDFKSRRPRLSPSHIGRVKSPLTHLISQENWTRQSVEPSDNPAFATFVWEEGVWLDFDRMILQCVSSTTAKHADGGVMIWVCFEELDHHWTSLMVCTVDDSVQFTSNIYLMCKKNTSFWLNEKVTPIKS